MEKLEAIKLMLDGKTLVSRDRFKYSFDFSTNCFCFEYGEVSPRPFDINSVSCSDCEVYVELHTLEEAVEHMDRDGVAELTIDTGILGISTGIRFKKTPVGLYKSIGTNCSLPFFKPLFKKVWKLLDIDQS